MKSITIHKMDGETGRALDALAAKEGTSLNRLVKRLLRKSLGLEPGGEDHRDDFAGFCGKWGQREAEEFAGATKCFDEIDEEVWK